ncbi:DsbC family protein [Paraburkholderia youngii]|uniref:DsbC family protein n=1 Tax=Paraburkholderia youngii TaxID=2782701 RepID=UPI003D225EBA
MKRLLPIVAAIMLSATAFAATPEDTIKSALERVGQPVQKVEPAPVAGLYAVYTDHGIIYADATGAHVIGGSIFDAATKVNLTDLANLAAQPKVDWASLPLNDAIKTVKGDGSRKFALFADPDCVYCARLYSDAISHLDNVTIYTFLFPIDSLHPGASDKSRKLWCAPDRAKAWEDWQSRHALAEDNGACSTPLERNASLAQRLHVTGTPVVIFADGTEAAGLRPLVQVQALLDRAQ